MRVTRRLRMTNTPEGATLVENGISVAPGFQVENVYVMAGVPQVAHAMIDWLALKLKGGQPVRSKTLVCSLGEGNMAQGLSAIQDRYAENRYRQLSLLRSGQLWHQHRTAPYRRDPDRESRSGSRRAYAIPRRGAARQDLANIPPIHPSTDLQGA